MSSWRKGALGATLTLLFPGWGLAMVCFAATAACRPLPLSAQPATSASGSWSVESPSSVNLWYHGLAVIGFEGFGPLPMYDRAYANRIREIKQRRGIYPTLLDRQATEFRNAFRRESAFEVLHFLPLYFVSLQPQAFLKAVRAISGANPKDLKGLDPATRRAIGALASVLGQRHAVLLAAFVDALDEERRVFYESYDSETYPARRLQTVRAERHWKTDLVPALGSYLKPANFGNVLIVASPALGGEGRSVSIGGADAATTIIAVTLPSPADDDGDAIPIAVVRELCFPLVHRVIARGERTESDRVAEERLSNVAAVRCGDLVLERYAPKLRNHYQSRYLRTLGTIGAEEHSGVAFAQAFYLQPAIEASLRRAIASL